MVTDYTFFNKNSVRLLTMHKIVLGNTYSIPFINKLVLFFPVHRVDDTDDASGYNYVYLYRFFFGRRAFLTRFRSYYSLGKWTHSLNVTLVIKKKEVYSVLYHVLNDLLAATEKNYLTHGLFSKKPRIYYLVFKDSNIFSERKTNLGLFALKNDLNSRIYCSGAEAAALVLMRNLKLYIF